MRTLIVALEPNRAGAIELFTKVERAGSYVFSGQVLYSWAPLILQRLRDDPAWPPWIPMKGDPAEPLIAGTTETQPTTQTVPRENDQ